MGISLDGGPTSPFATVDAKAPSLPKSSSSVPKLLARTSRPAVDDTLQADGGRGAPTTQEPMRGMTGLHRPQGPSVGLRVSAPQRLSPAAQLRVGIDDVEWQGVLGVRFVAFRQFMQDLPANKEQVAVLAALMENPEFKRITNWLEQFPGGNPVGFATKPGLESGGDELYGGFSCESMVVVLNPTKAEHLANPQEVVNTLVHELIHAVEHVSAKAEKLGLKVPPKPYDASVTDLYHDPNIDSADRQASVPTLRENYQMAHEQAHMEGHYGPAYSVPEQEYVDVNLGTQELIERVIQDNIAKTGIGFSHEGQRLDHLRAERFASSLPWPLRPQL